MSAVAETVAVHRMYNADRPKVKIRVRGDQKSSSSRSHRKRKCGKDDDVIEVCLTNFRKEKKQILAGGWRNHPPTDLVRMCRDTYSNLSTLSVTLSRLKSSLLSLPKADRPPKEYTDQLKLTKKEYSAIRSAYQARRFKKGMSLSQIRNADQIIVKAMKYICSSDPRVVYCGLLPLTGLRSADILKCATFSLKTNSPRKHSAWWAQQLTFAKRRRDGPAGEFSGGRDRPFLAPAYLILRGIRMCRKHWSFCKTSTTIEINARLNGAMNKRLRQAYPELYHPTHTLFRRLFGIVAYPYFKNDISPSGVCGRNSFLSYCLGHQCLNDQVLSYAQISLQNCGKIPLFDLGRKLRARD